MPLQIIRNDITKVAADAIVNTANPDPEVGGGTDWAIHNAAGLELLEARKKIGKINVGQSFATPAFALPAKYVLHTVSPFWAGGQYGEEEKLIKAYDSALFLADELKCKSIAFPLMAAGTYGFPHDIALSTAIRAFTDFLLEHEMKIYLVLFNAEAFGVAGSLFDDLKSYIDDNYVSEREEQEYEIDQLPELLSRERSRSRIQRKNRPRRAEKEATVGAQQDRVEECDKLELRPPETASLEEILRQQKESSFREYLLNLLRERDGKDSEVYKRAEISKQVFSNILNREDYQPTKSTVIQLAIGLQLDLPQTQKLLDKAGFTLTRGNKRDLAIKYFIERKIYNVTFINEALYDCGLPLLTTGTRA